MRKIEYLSPSSLALWLKDKREYYLSYLCETRAPRMAQTQPMSIGSAFDAYAKNFLHEKLFGKANDSRFELVTIFEAQVEAHNRDWAWEHGKYVFECYRNSGALSDLLLELESSVGTPRFEIEVRGVVNGQREGITRDMPGGVTFLGKPDVFYINKHGCHVILDFKVNGYCGNHNTSPKAGYLRLRPGSGQVGVTGPHKDCIPMVWQGTMINIGKYLEDVDQDWARQLSIYGWLVGLEVGEEAVTAIDQIVCKPNGKFPLIRIAEHRLRVKSQFQWETYAKAQELWEIIHSDHIFRDMPLEESKSACQLLDNQCESLKNPATPEDAMFNQMTRGF